MSRAGRGQCLSLKSSICAGSSYTLALFDTQIDSIQNQSLNFELRVKEVLKLVEYDEDIITAPQWIPIWRLWSPLGLFTVFSLHFLSSPQYLYFRILCK